MTWIERYTAAADAYKTARDEYRTWFDAAVKAEYARRRAADKAAGRDTGGGSVQGRHQLAYDRIMMSSEARTKIAEVERLHQEFTEASTPKEA